MSTPPIALVGLRASGKTTIGRALAARLKRTFVDLDEEIVSAAGDRGSLGQIYVDLGDEMFREVESFALAGMIVQLEPIVLATGGGIVERRENLDLLRERAIVVWLQVDVAELQRRLSADPKTRPPLTPQGTIAEVPAIAARREPLYASIARLTVRADQGDPEEIAERIALDLASAGLMPGPKRRRRS